MHKRTVVKGYIHYFVSNIYIYIYLYTYTHTHTHLLREQKAGQSYNLKIGNKFLKWWNRSHI